MKKVLMICVVLMVVTISSAFANNSDGVNDRIVNNFNKEFVKASSISWEVTRDFVKATFTLNEQVMYVYYSPQGEKIALIRNVRSSQLPMVLLNRLKKEHEGFWISDLFEIAGNDGTTYYATIENADLKIVLKSIGTLDWTTFKKSEKQY